MIKRRIKLNGFSVLSIGFSAACLALACGSNDVPAGEDDPPVEVQPPNECEENPYLEDCPGNEPTVEPPTGTGGTGAVGPGPDPGREPTQEELEIEQVENILKAKCGSCHGTQLTPATAEAGMNFIDDIEALADNNKIIPLDAESSPIILRMRNGSMPPGAADVPKAEIDIVANFINNPDRWDVPAVSCSNNPPLSFDDLYADVAGDLRGEDEEDRPFLRYITLENRTAAGICANTALDVDRQALTKLVNMLSIDATIVQPDVINEQQTLYRIDLRDVQWDREVTVDGQPFADVWEAIIDANEYAVPFEGDDADDARDDALTSVPVMFLDSMLDQAAIGNLYYAIIDVDVNQTLDAFVLDTLGIDVQANIDNEDVVRAGTTKSRISRQDRLIEGHEIEERAGVYYQSFDFNDVQNESIFQNPFGFNEGGREAIFTLPNGMLAYLIADADGNLVQDSDILLDTSQNNFRAVTSVSCSSCHAAGLIPVIDEVRTVVESNARNLVQDGTLNQDQLEQLRAIYLEPEAFKRQIEEQSNTFYLNALRQADLPLNGPEPISTTFSRFDRDMNLKVAAGDLGLSADELDRELALLDPVLGVLRDGTIDRDDFTAQYVESLCILNNVNRNRPEQAVCDAVLGE